MTLLSRLLKSFKSRIAASSPSVFAQSAPGSSRKGRYDMPNLKKCPSCGNTKDGDVVHRCRECGKTFCESCGGDKFGDACPKCDIPAPKVGEINT